MKQLFILSFLTTCSLAAIAQARIGITAGYARSNVSMEAATYSTKGLSFSATAGLQAGILADIPFGEYFSIQPGLRYLQRGFDAKGVVPGPSDGPIDANIATRYHYLQLPLHFTGKFPVGPGRIFAGAGPILAYGISGRVKSSYVDHWAGYAPESSMEKVYFLDKERDYEAAVTRKQYIRPFDAGAGFTAGYEFQFGLMIGAGYTLGLTDVDPHPHISQKSKSWSVSVGYLLPRR